MWIDVYVILDPRYLQGRIPGSQKTDNHDDQWQCSVQDRVQYTQLAFEIMLRYRPEVIIVASGPSIRILKCHHTYTVHMNSYQIYYPAAARN